MRKLLVSLLVSSLFVVSLVKAEECDNPGSLSDTNTIGQCIGKYSGILEAISKANTNNKKDLANLNAQVTRLKSQISSLEVQLQKLAKDIFEREVKVGIKQKVLAARVRRDYVRRREQPVLLMLFAPHAAGSFFRDLEYREKAANADRKVIADVSEEIRMLNAQSIMLKNQKESLAGLKARVDKQAAVLAAEVAKASEFESALASKIAALSARQQAILAEKTGTFQTTVGDVPLADDPAARPDYNPGFSPAFAVFSFGAPHFKGMSQYGALGRAKSGQNYEQILKAYYGSGAEIRDHNPDAQITVSGYGTYSLEEYVKRIYEMPGSWGDEGGMEALKAQAVAVRSYALAHGGPICATEQCQVFKPSPKGGKWEEAVNQTRGKVVYANGAPFSTWYASTSGGYQESYSGNGYTTPGFWDTPNDRGGWTSQAYEKTAGSPWFYKGWYRDRSGDSCGRGHPWLSSEELADILNAWVVLFQGGGDAGRVLPRGACWGGNPYSLDELRAIGGYSGVSGVSVTHNNGGFTENVSFETNKGSVTIAGGDFKKAFNLRAPGKIAVKSGLFNIEKK